MFELKLRSQQFFIGHAFCWNSLVSVFECCPGTGMENASVIYVGNICDIDCLNQCVIMWF